MNGCFIKCLGVLLMLGSAIFAPLSAAEPAANFEFFETKIRPILLDRCYKCHSAESEKIKGGLLLDTREGPSGASSPTRSTRTSPATSSFSTW